MDGQEEGEESEIPIGEILDPETLAHYQARARAAGRTLSDQLVYEFKVNRGLCQPDPADKEATERGELFRRMQTRSPLKG